MHPITRCSLTLAGLVGILAFGSAAAQAIEGASSAQTPAPAGAEAKPAGAVAKAGAGPLKKAESGTAAQEQAKKETTKQTAEKKPAANPPKPVAAEPVPANAADNGGRGAAEAAPGMISAIKIDADEKITALSVIFPPGTDAAGYSHSVTGHGLFIQMNINGAVTPEPGQFIAGQGPYVKKIAVFQPGEDSTSIRIFTNGSSVAVGAGMHAETLDNRILLTIDHAVVASKMAGEAGLDASAQPQSGTEGISGKGVAPTEAVTGKTAGNGDFHDRLEASTTKAAVVSAALFVVFLTLMYMKRRGRRLAAKGGVPAAQPTFRNLGAFSISAKQRLIVMEVSGERILLASTPTGVQFLTRLGEGPANFAAHLQQEPQRPRQSTFLPETAADAAGRETITMQPQRFLPEGARKVLQAIREKQGAAAAGYDDPEEITDESDHRVATTGRPQRREPAGDVVRGEPQRQKQPRERQAPADPNRQGSAVREKAAPKGNAGNGRLALRIDDDGVTDLNSPARSQGGIPNQPRPGTGAGGQAGPANAVEDITAMIRRKLRELPKIV